MTWSDIYYRYIRLGYDHGYAAWKVDQWEKQHGKTSKV